jgi:hypothetical protein
MEQKSVYSEKRRRILISEMGAAQIVFRKTEGGYQLPDKFPYARRTGRLLNLNTQRPHVPAQGSLEIVLRRASRYRAEILYSEKNLRVAFRKSEQKFAAIQNQPRIVLPYLHFVPFQYI